MNKEEFANLLEGFDFNIIEEYWLRVKSSDNISFQLVNGFEKELDRLDQLEELLDKTINDICYIEHNLEKYEELGHLPGMKEKHFDYALNKVYKLKETLLRGE